MAKMNHWASMERYESCKRDVADALRAWSGDDADALVADERAMDTLNVRTGEQYTVSELRVAVKAVLL